LNRHRPNSAFTLLELVLVLVIIGGILAMAAPSLSGWNRGSKLRDAGDQFLAVTRYARATAVTQAQLHRLNVDPATGTYWLTSQQGQTWIPAQSTWGQQFTIPAGFAIEMTDPQGRRLDSIDFYPNGRTQPARIQIGSANFGVVGIECTLAGEGFHLASSQNQP
jgi:type II secretion system protein H